MGIIFPAPAWAVRTTKESDKINIGWGCIKYSLIGVTEWCNLPNTAAIKLPNHLTRTLCTGSAPGSQVLGSSSAASAERKASAHLASAPPAKPTDSKAESEKAAPQTAAPKTTAAAEPKDYSHEITVRFPVLVNTRDLLPGEELFRRETKQSKKREHEPVAESALLRRARTAHR